MAVMYHSAFQWIPVCMDVEDGHKNGKLNPFLLKQSSFKGLFNDNNFAVSRCNNIQRSGFDDASRASEEIGYKQKKACL